MVSFDARLFERGGQVERRRRQIVQVMQAALDAVDPYAAVLAAISRDDDTLVMGGETIDLTKIDRVLVVGAGKAGAPMARAVEELLGDRITAGVVNVKYDHVQPTTIVAIREAGHPMPDEAGVAGATEIAAMLTDATERDLVICVISGGGSALMTLPVPGVTLDDMRALTEALLRAGASIVEINAIRKHLDRVKGGGLARLAAPARVVSLILSDVVGNPLDAIASGPTVPDTSTFQEAVALLRRYGLWESIATAIRAHLEAGVNGETPDTPKAGSPVFEGTHNLFVASNGIAADAALRTAKALGFNTLFLSTYVEGEAREVARVQAAIAKEILDTGRPIERPACVISGGETTVTLRGGGKGGRNQEMALAAALSISGMDDVTIACLATDGTDGPTDASGALADGTTIARAEAAGLDAWAHLDDNNAYPFFEALDDLLLTGPTNTNVNDLTLVFVW